MRFPADTLPTGAGFMAGGVKQPAQVPAAEEDGAESLDPGAFSLSYSVHGDAAGAVLVQAHVLPGSAAKVGERGALWQNLQQGQTRMCNVYWCR